MRNYSSSSSRGVSRGDCRGGRATTGSCLVLSQRTLISAFCNWTYNNYNNDGNNWMAQTFSLATSAEASPFFEGGSLHIHRGILTKHTKHKTWNRKQNKSKRYERQHNATQRNQINKSTINQQWNLFSVNASNTIGLILRHIRYDDILWWLQRPKHICTHTNLHRLCCWMKYLWHTVYYTALQKSAQ